MYAYTDVGTGPTIIFAHGLFLDRSSFDQQVAVLSQNYRCIVLDMPGHGESGVFPPQWTLDDMANDIALLVQVLALGKVILVGQSLGGMMGIRLAALHPDVVSYLILVGKAHERNSQSALPTGIICCTLSLREPKRKEWRHSKPYRNDSAQPNG